MVRQLFLATLFFFPFVQPSLGFVVKGKVVQSDGQTPAPGIVVRATHMRDRVPGIKDEFQKKVATTADGTFSMELPPYEDLYNVCLLDDQGHCYWGQAHINATGDLGAIKLERGCELSGKVRIKDGKPLAGIEIQLQLRLKVCHHLVDAATAVSATDGTFTFPDLSPGEYTYQLKGGAYAVKPGTLNVSDDPSYLELTLEKAATIKGVVKDDQGKPMAGIHVATETGATTLTDADGKYLLSGIPIGSWSLYARGNGYLQKEDAADKSVKCEAGSEVVRNFTVIRSGSLVVQVKLADNGDGMPAQLKVGFGRKTGNHSSRQTQQSEPLTNGAAIFKDITPANYKVTIMKGKGTWATTNLAIVSGQESKLSVILPHVIEVRGRITDEVGKPVEDAHVRVTPHKGKGATDTDDGGDYERGQYLTSDTNGVYFAEGLSEGERIKLFVTYQKLVPADRIVVVKNGQPAEDFVLKKGLMISGSVLEADGQPAKSINVSLSMNHTATKPDQYEMMSAMSRSAEVDDKGGFELSGLLPGKYDLSFRKTDGDTQEEETSLPGVEAGTDDVLVTLGKKQTIKGRVCDRDGKPLAKVNINISKSQEDGRSYRRYSRGDSGGGSKTGADGNFSLPVRGGTKYSVSFSLFPYVPKTETVDLKAATPPAPLSLQLERGNKVTGLVVDDKGVPVAGLKVNQSGADMYGNGGGEEDDAEADPTSRNITNAKGEFELDGVSPGVVSFSVSMKTNDMSVVLARKGTMISRDKPNNIKILLPAMGSVKGLVVDDEGKPVPEASVTLYSQTGGSSMSAQTDESGRFTMGTVPAGSYMVMWFNMKRMSEAREMKPVAVKVKGGEASEVTLGKDLPKANTMTVKGVVRKNGSALGAGTIKLFPLPKEDSDDPTAFYGLYSGRVNGAIDQSGGFVLSNLTAGTYGYHITPGKSGRSPEDEDEEVSSFSGEIALDAGQQQVEINLTGVTVTGSVLGPDSKPLAQCPVTIVSSKQKQYKAYLLSKNVTTDSQGRFKAECVTPGAYNIMVREKDGVTGGLKSAGISENSKHFDIVLGPSFKVGGKITIVGGDSAEGASVLAISEDEIEGSWAQVSSSGDYELKPRLAGGTHTVFVSRSEYAIDAVILDVRSDLKHDVKLVPGGTLQVKVTSENSPVKGQKIRIKDADGHDVIRLHGGLFAGRGGWDGVYAAPTDENGKTMFPGLRPGKYTVSADGKNATASVEVKALETAEVELKL